MNKNVKFNTQVNVIHWGDKCSYTKEKMKKKKRIIMSLSFYMHV